MDKDIGIGQLGQVFKIKAFLLLWLTQLLSQVGFNMLVFILGVVVYRHTHTNTSVSLLFLVVGLPATIFGIASGVLVDRLPKRRVLVVTTCLRGIIMLILYLVRRQLILLYILLGGVSILTQFFVPAEAALIPRFVPQKLLLSANSLFTLTFYSAIIGGFVIGGLLLDKLGVGNSFILLAGVFFIATILLKFIPDIKDQLGTNKLNLSSIWRDLVNTYIFIRRNPAIYQAILLMTLAQAIISVFVTLGPGFADRILSIKITEASLYILAPAAIGMIIGALVVGSWGRRYRKRTLINFGIFSSGFLLLLVSFFVWSTNVSRVEAVFVRIFSISLESGLLPISIACFFFLGFANSFIDVTCNTVLQEQTSESLRGKVYGLLLSLISGVGLLPVIISGIIADLFGIGKIIFILGITLVLFGILTSNSWWRKIRLYP